MKKIATTILVICIAICAQAQDFGTDINNVRANYAAGKLSDAHFNVQQAMSEIDLLSGKDVLKILPPAMDTLATNPSGDRVTSATGFLGAIIHRNYGTYVRSADVEIITNSPMIATLNALMNSPMGGVMMNSDKSKQIMVSGYKARMDKNTNMQGQSDYTIQIPLSSTLITFKVTNSTDGAAIALAQTIPIPQIAQLLQ